MITRARSMRALRTGTWAVLALALACAQASQAHAQARRARKSEPPASSASEAPPAVPTADAAGGADSVAPSGTAGPASSTAPAASSATNTPSAEASATQATPDATKNAATAEANATADEARAVREELSSVMDALVSARARAALLGKSLFKTKVRVHLVNEAAEDQALGKVALFLDGNPIFRGEGSALNAEGAKLFEGYAAPGPHVLKVSIEQRSRADDNYRYSQDSMLRFTVLRGHLTDLKLVLDDDSDIAEDFADDQEGEYDVSLKLEVEATPLPGAGGS